jgi:hypothetical protein
MTIDTLPTSITDISDIDDAEAVRWLSDALEPARKLAKDMPTPDAVARMRARLFTETAESADADDKNSRIAA